MKKQTLALVLVAAVASGVSPARAGRTRPALFKDSRQTLAIARAQGRKEVSVLLAAKPGAAASVAKEAAKLGGDVRYRDDEVGYLRVKVPIDQATALAEFAGVQAASLDYDDNYPNRLGPGRGALPLPDPEADGPSAPAWPPTLSEYPLAHPYSPIRDLAAADFLAQHPTWDGRGVVIGVLDGNLDMLLPEFQTAYALDGKKIPKFADYLNVTDPRDDADINPQWVDMKQVVTSSGGTVSFQGKTFRVPKDGSYRIGLFSERKWDMDSNASYIDQDIDRNGNPKGDDGLFGVLWDEKSNDVWVDTNRDGNFGDEKAMTDYVRRPEFGVFGKEDPSTPWRDTIGFAVQTDAKNKFVSINVGIYQHCTTIMGSVVGNKEPNGRLQGVAPGAQLVSLFYGVSNAHGLIEGLIAAFKHPKVDVIVLEQSVAIASIPYLLADATHPMSVVAQRLTDRYKKLMFVPGDNSPAFGFVAEDGLAPGAMSVGGYQSKESYRVNNGLITEHDDNLHWGALSHGPSGNGGLKPDILAPSGQMGTEVGYRKGAGQKGLYSLPPGYSVDGGTSTATPMAAGATALVVSAAKQTGVPYDAVRLKAALTGSARHIDNLGAHEQGNGLIQVGPAYALLQKFQKTPPIVITGRAPVRTVLADLLTPPNQGLGIYEREGWKAGDRGDRTVTLTRETGPAAPMTFTISWAGNDGTFESPTSVVLPLKTPVDLKVSIFAKKEGAHTALMTLDNPDVPGHAYRMLDAVVVPYRLTPENGYAVKGDLTPALPGDAGFFVEVPPDVPVLAFHLSNPIFGGSAIGPDKDAQYVCSFDLHWEKPQRCAIANPQPGVWELNVSNSFVARNFDPENPSPMKAAPVTVSATALGVDVGSSAAPAALGAGRSEPLSLTLANRLGKASSTSATSVDLGSAVRRHAAIAEGGQDSYEIDVPKGATSLMVRVAGARTAGGGAADLDLYLLNCTKPEAPETPEAPKEELEKGNKSPMRPPAPCAPAGKAASRRFGGQLEVSNPKPGRWVAVVDAYQVPGGGTVQYDYTDFFSHPSFGSVSVADLPDDRASAARWTAAGNAWSAKMPDAPREPAARVIATSPDAMRIVGFGTADNSRLTLGEYDIWFATPAAAGGGGR
ncbi:MAG TPA: S8 family serine peptidase [Thermoanaerobaculia bacterium]